MFSGLRVSACANYREVMEIESRKPAKAKRDTTVSAVLKHGSMVELLYQPARRETLLALYKSGVVTTHQSLKLESGETLVPIPASNNLIKHQVLLLPESATAFGSILELVEEIRRYLVRYVDLTDEFLGIASYYVLLTWVYDAFNELPYLRMRGDFGCGKTRALLIIGSICYKPFFASGASTVSPIFHAIDTFRGTLIFDEADFRFSDEKAELVKIFNNGNVRGFPVLRAAMTAKKEFDPQAFLVFGPKLVAMRESFQDVALESRFLTEEMGQHALRKNIPINLPDVQKDEALKLRNKLLMFRFETFGSTRIDATLVDPELSPRLNQILVPLLSIVGDEAVRHDIRRAVGAFEQQLRAERSLAPEAQLLQVLTQAFASADGDKIALAEVTRLFIQQFGADYERPITNRYIGSLLRRRLRIATYKSHGTYVVPLSEGEKLKLLCVRYGVAVD